MPNITSVRSLRARVFRPALMPLLAILLAISQGCTTATPAASSNEHQAIVVAAHPLAVDAGVAVLKRGGSALDAAIAVQAMLGLVEPQSSGLGGGAIIMAYDAHSGKVASYLGREAAPAAATSALLDDADGHPMPTSKAMLTGRATGVPAAVAAFAAAHKAHGKLPWSELFDESIAQAEKGFRVTPRLSQHIHGTFPQASAPDVRTYFSDASGRLLDTGDLLRNRAYADTLRLLAKGGPDAFYHGPLARAIVARTHDAPMGGAMTEADLAGYQLEQAPPLCRPLRQYVLCVPLPPTSGVGLLQLMELLDGTDIDQRGPADPQAWFLFAEASRLMYADRDQYVGDPRFTKVPVEGLLDPAYVARRRNLIGDTAGAPPLAGTPPGADTHGSDNTLEPGGTSQIVVVDAQGNAVSITTTIESFFGSGRMVGGFFLNNQLTDFSWSAGVDRQRAANAIAGGKRPRSSMTPAILLDRQGRLLGAIGSPGGNAIPAYVAKALVGALYWKLPLSQAVALPNLVARGKHFDGEANAFDPEVLKALAERGVEVKAGSGENSGLHGVLLRDGKLEWAADPRREGTGRSPD